MKSIKITNVVAKLFLLLSVFLFGSSTAFHGSLRVPSDRGILHACALSMAQQQVTEVEARKGIDKVVNALRKDKAANEELGRLDKVTVVLGYGAPNDTLNVRFNASFRKGGKGMMAVPMPFMLGQTNKSEGRGQMVGQVKASVDMKRGKVSSCSLSLKSVLLLACVLIHVLLLSSLYVAGKVTSCSVFRDLGYGRSFMLKC